MKAETAKDEVVLNDDELICILTELRKKATPKEIVLQSVIQQMNDEYGFELADMEREFSFQYEDEFGKSKRGNIDLAIFRAGAGHDAVNLERICVVCDNKVSVEDKKLWRGFGGTDSRIPPTQLWRIISPPGLGAYRMAVC